MIRKFIILFFSPVLAYSFDPYLMQYCHERNTCLIQERCQELLECGPEEELDAVLAEMYVAYKMQREVRVSLYIERIDEILKRHCEK